MPERQPGGNDVALGEAPTADGEQTSVVATGLEPTPKEQIQNISGPSKVPTNTIVLENGSETLTSPSKNAQPAANDSGNGNSASAVAPANERQEGGKKPEAAVPATNKSKTAAKGAASKRKSNKMKKPGKEVPSSERDTSCINALLSLGRDLPYQTSENGGSQPPIEEEESTCIESKKPPTNNLVPILPAMESNGPPKKRQKIGENPVNGHGGFQYPPDFWYWLPPGESIGDWDVLCGRGGESNNFVGNKKYRRVVNERKEAYRSIPLKQRKAKTAFVRSIVQHVNNCGGRFIELDESSGRYYVVTMEKARKKTSQALRETKELKWLEIETRERRTPSNKNSICPFCKKAGHKTKIAKACLLHHEWLDANSTKIDEDGAIFGFPDPIGPIMGSDATEAAVRNSYNKSLNGAPIVNDSTVFGLGSHQEISGSLIAETVETTVGPTTSATSASAMPVAEYASV